MKIEVGKFYKTRDGRKARIYAVDGACKEIHGAVLVGGGVEKGWNSREWYSNGEFNPSQDQRDHLDLISEWTEPAPKLIAWISADGLVCFTAPNRMPCDITPKNRGIRWERAPWLDEPNDE